MIKILFYQCNDTVGPANDKIIYLGVAALYLKTYIEKNYSDLAAQIEWLLPIQHKLNDNELIKLINEHKPTLICSSHYIWNHDLLLKQMSRIKPMVSADILFLAGGPSIDVNIDPEFFQKYPFIDYAFYGAAEVAFVNLVQCIVNKTKPIAFNTSNIAWFDNQKNKTVIAEYKYVPQLAISPYTANQEFFTRMVRFEQQNNVSVIVPYEVTRGCPYSCTFCDWNSGLSNKTTRRKDTYQSEIDLFQKLNIKNLYLSDANVGQYQEDIDMIAYLAKKNIEENAGFKVDGNYSKLRKENNLKIYHLIAQGNLFTDYAGFTISVQDINPAILKNIDRPDVGWQVHVNMIQELKQAYPHINSKVQLIQGLPGQTPISWRETLKEISRYDLQLQIFISELLPASAAARNKEYHEKFKFVYSHSERYNSVELFRGTFPESCSSFTKTEFVEMTLLSHIYTALMILRPQLKMSFDVEKAVDYFLKSDHYINLTHNLTTNWLHNDKFYYLIDFDGKQKLMSACDISETGAIWASNLSLIKLISNTVGEQKNMFIKKHIKLVNKQLHVNIEHAEGFA